MKFFSIFNSKKKAETPKATQATTGGIVVNIGDLCMSGYSEFINDQLDKAAENNAAKIIKIEINSNGGYVDEAVKILNKLKELKTKGFKIHALVYKAYSASALIAAFCDHVTAYNNLSKFMIHNTFLDMYCSNKEELAKAIKVLNECDNFALEILRNKLNLSKESIEKALTAETYYTASEAQAIGFVDELLGYSDDQVVNANDLIKEVQNRSLIGHLMQLRNMDEVRNAVSGYNQYAAIAGSKANAESFFNNPIQAVAEAAQAKAEAAQPPATQEATQSEKASYIKAQQEAESFKITSQETELVNSIVSKANKI